MTESTLYRPDEPGAQPPSLFAPYGSTVKRAPSLQPILIPQTLTETTGPTAWAELMGGSLADLTTQHKGVPLEQRIVVGGRVMDDEHRPVANTVIEIWQANSAGRYIHVREETRCHRVRLVPASRARSAAERAIC